MITFANQFYSKYYYSRRAMLSISNDLSLHGIPEGAIVCNVKHHVGDCGIFTRMSRDYTIVINHNPNNGAWTGGAAHRGRNPPSTQS